jgi:3-deoxy-7-phosphoheptulonate synthase|uniref:3-deoxy-7-phosphoheptulonate synthase n=1 Tax=candidate division WOR-3 bacterium TaxID=2052148 RepID=A0A7V3RGT3_UNCW3
MLVVMHKDATEEQIKNVCRVIKEMGLKPHPIKGAQRVAIGITGNKDMVDKNRLEGLDGVIDVIVVTKPYKLTSREMKPDDTKIKVGNVIIGDKKPVIIAGPCAVESEMQTIEIARAVKNFGADLLRGGAFKPRTSPYTFQGLGEEGLKILAKAKEETGLPVVSEAIDTETFPLVEEYVDIIQIGARNMQNYSLLKKAGMSKKPILLKRGMASTIQEFLLAAEYIMSEGNYNVILCERGIRTFSDFTRFTLDISSIPELKRVSHLPVIVDPSHASGKRDMVLPLSRAAIAAGADGIMVEVHNNPDKALSDGPQSLTIEGFKILIEELRHITRAIGRTDD